MEAGHRYAQQYPLGMLFDEARLVVVRRNGIQATEATLLQAAAATLFSEKAGRNFQELVENLTEE